MIDKDLYPQDETVTTKQCAAAAGINRRTVVAWIKAGILPATRPAGIRSHYRILWGEFWRVLHTPVRPD